MQGVTTIGLDIAKSVFQVHGVDAIGSKVAKIAMFLGLAALAFLAHLVCRIANIARFPGLAILATLVGSGWVIRL